MITSKSSILCQLYFYFNSNNINDSNKLDQEMFLNILRYQASTAAMLFNQLKDDY